MEKVIKLTSSFFKVHYFPFVVGGIFLTLFLPYVVGVRNSDVIMSAFIVERFFTLIGILLFIPLFLPDVNLEALTIIRTKTTPYWHILCIRFALIMTTTTALTFVFLWTLRLNHATFPFDTFFLGTLAIIIFLGGLSSFSFSLSRQPIIGLMASLIYYFACMFGGHRYLGQFYLFNLANFDWQSRLLLFTVGSVLMGLSVLYANYCKD